MSLPSFDELFTAADALPQPVPVAAAGGDDATVIQALELARRRGWVQPILTGNRQRIAEIAAGIDVDLSTFTVLDDAADSAVVAVSQVREGRARLLMKGQIATPALMKGVLDREHGLRTGRTICQVVLMEITRDERSFLMTDTGVTVAPTIDQKVDMLRSMLEIARSLDCRVPRVAIMSATEKPTDVMPDTLDAAALTQRAASGEFGECIVKGPLSFDLAYARDAGHKKKIVGEVTGAADAMLFPNLLAANLTVKAIMYTADCRFGGVLAGAACPVVFMSRADTVETRLNSLAYAIHMLGRS